MVGVTVTDGDGGLLGNFGFLSQNGNSDVVTVDAGRAATTILLTLTAMAGPSCEHNLINTRTKTKTKVRTRRSQLNAFWSYNTCVLEYQNDLDVWTSGRRPEGLVLGSGGDCYGMFINSIVVSTYAHVHVQT